MLCAAAAVAASADDACPDPVGHEQEILDGEVLIKLTDFPGSAAKEGCVLGYIAAPPEKVMAILRDAGKYAEYMPKVLSSEVDTGDDGVVLNRQELNLPWPIGDRNFIVRLVEKKSKDGVYRFDFDYVKGSGNVDDTRGHWLIEPWKNGSRVTYALWCEPGGAIPGWAVNRASRRTLPLVIVALRDRVLDRPPSRVADDDDGDA